jgi:hypothetical protein
MPLLQTKNSEEERKEADCAETTHNQPPQHVLAFEKKALRDDM